jgi:hypothetical protein
MSDTNIVGDTADDSPPQMTDNVPTPEIARVRDEIMKDLTPKRGEVKVDKSWHSYWP